MTSFLDRIDQALQYTNHPLLIKSLFRGTLIDRLVCPHCGEIRHSEVPFTNISVEVKDVLRLEDSLKRFGESESIDGETVILILIFRLSLFGLWEKSYCPE